MNNSKNKAKADKAKEKFHIWHAHFVEESGYGIKHGDYQRIASLTRGPEGKPYTSDYVRKVIKGERMNPAIYKVAKAYLIRQAKLYKDLNHRAG